MKIFSCAVIFLSLLAVGCEGEPQVPSETEEVATTDTSETLFPVRRDGQWGYIDRTGRTVVAPQFDRTWRFTEGLGLVKSGESFGFIRPDGSFGIRPRFSDAWHFSGGLAPVEIDGRWAYVDPEGEIVADTQFHLERSALVQSTLDSDLFQLVRSEGQYGYSSANGDTTIDPRFENAWYFSDGMARVKQDGKWGYIDRNGDFVIEPTFDAAWDFRDGLAMVRIGDRIGYIDREGEYVWPPSP